MTISLKSEVVKGLLMCAGVEARRPYLQGIQFEPDGFAIATDEHCLLALRITKFEGPDFFVSRAQCELKLKGVKRGHVVTLVEDGDASKFPNWRRVVPQNIIGGSALFDCELVERTARAVSLVTASHCVGLLQQNSNGAALMRTPPEVLALVMPVRDTGKFNEYDHVQQFLKVSP